MTFIWIQVVTLVFLGNVLLSHQTAKDTKLSIIYKWRALDKKIEYPSEEAKNAAIERGEYIPRNVLLICADYHLPSGRMFITSTQFKEGVPASLFEVTRSQGLLRPFPNWPTYVNNRPSCRDIFSVFRIHIDQCGLMWVLDSGRSGMLINSTLICQPKVLIFDLNNRDRLISYYAIPQGVATERSRLTTIITESYKSDCSDSTAYIADGNDHALIVYDYPRQTSWRVENALFWPYPMPDQFLSGLFGLALDPPTESDRKLYFHSFSSVKESWVPVRVVKNESIAGNPFMTRGTFINSPGERTGISTVEVMTDDGIMIYALLQTNEIACWNSKTPYTLENQHTLLRDDENFQFISGLKLKGNALLITSCRFQAYSAGIADGTDVTSRVMVIEDVKRLLQNTPCTAPPNGGSNGVSTENSRPSTGYYANNRLASSQQSKIPEYRGSNAISYRPSYAASSKGSQRAYAGNGFVAATTRNSLSGGFNTIPDTLSNDDTYWGYYNNNDNIWNYYSMSPRYW